MSATGTVGLSGTLTRTTFSRSRMEKEARRRVFWWHVRNWLTVRYREIPTSLFLLFLPLLKFFIPSLCVMKSELCLKVYRGNEKARLYRDTRNKRVQHILNTWYTPLATEEDIAPNLLEENGIYELDRSILANSIVEDYGVVGRHLITTAGKQYVASCFDNTAEPEVFKYHGYGTGTGAAAIGDTTLGTELTTQYVSDNNRPTGSQAHSAATYTTVGTLSPDSGGTIAVTEWGLFSQAANSGGTLLDRQVFSAVNLVAGSDSEQTTYVLTIA